MKNIIIFIGVIFFSLIKGYGTTISYNKLYEFEATLTDGKHLKGSVLHLNYDTVPSYQFTDKAFLAFLSRISQYSQGKITVYSRIQPLKIDSVQPWIGYPYAAVIASDLHQVAVEKIQAVKFKKGTPSDGLVILTQLSQTQINQINRGIQLLYQFNYPLDNDHLEESDLHLLLGNINQPNQKAFEQQIIEVYENKANELTLNETKWKKLQLLYRNKGLILIRLIVTDYFIAEAGTF